mgnify:CR=1 FL=1
MSELNMLSTMSPTELDEFKRSIKAIDMKKPNLDPYEKVVSEMLGNIFTLSREVTGRNLSDTGEKLQLDTAVNCMVDCVYRFEQQVRRENLI